MGRARRGRAGLGAGVAVAAMFGAARGYAAPSARLTYERGAGAEACPDEGVLRRAVEQRLGYDPFFPWADRTIVARIAREAHTLGASIELLDGAGIVRGSRKLAAPATDCKELVSGMALAISIAVDPSSVDRAPPPAGAASAESDPSVVEWTSARAEESASLPRKDERRAPRPAPRHVNRARVVWDVAGGVTSGAFVAPGALLGPMLGTAFTVGPWGAGVEGRYLFGFDAAFGPGSVSSSLVEAMLVGCFHPGALFACAEASIGRLGISGAGVSRPSNDSALVGWVGARAGVDVSLSSEWVGELSADLMFPFPRQTVAFDGNGVWESSAVGGLFTLAVRRRFP